MQISNVEILLILLTNMEVCLYTLFAWHTYLLLHLSQAYMSSSLQSQPKHILPHRLVDNQNNTTYSFNPLLQHKYLQEG